MQASAQVGGSMAHQARVARVVMATAQIPYQC
jgi:hypothetical protein